MRRSFPAAGILSLALLAAGCAFRTPPAGPSTMAVATAPDAPRINGFAGEIEPLAAPIALAYRPARFSGVTTIGVQMAGAPASRLSIHTSGELAALAEDRLRVKLVTDHVDVDGRRSDNGSALLVQELALGRHGELLEMSSRTPAATGRLGDRYRTLEQGWRERLPLLSQQPVAAAGGPIEAEDRRLTALRLMLGGRDVRLEPLTPLRTVIVGIAPCAAGTCLIGPRVGKARLVGARGDIEVEIGGYGLLDPATGLFIEERERILLVAKEPDGTPRRLEMTVDSDLTLR